MVVKNGYIRVVECFEFTKIQKITTFIRAPRMISSASPRISVNSEVFRGLAGLGRKPGFHVISRIFTYFLRKMGLKWGQAMGSNSKGF